MDLPKVIIWLDPGQKTGVAAWTRPDVRSGLALADGTITTPPREFETTQVLECHTQLGLKALHDTIKRYIAYAIPIRNSDSITLGYETFDFRHEEQPRDKIDYIAREVIGATRAWALEWTYAATLRMNAGTGKGFWNDDKLQRIGVYVPGQPHAMDALRHLLRYMTFGLKQQEIMMRLRPSSLHISGS